MTKFIPDNLSVIGAGNVGSLTEIARIGRGNVHQVAYLPNGKYLAAASSIGIWLYDVGFQNEPLLLGKYEYGNQIVFSGNGQLIAVPDRNKTIGIWNIDTLEQIQSIQTNQEPLDSLAMNPAGTSIATGGWNKAIHFWNTQTGSLDKTFSCEKPIRSLAFNQDGTHLAIGGTDGMLLS